MIRVFLTILLWALVLFFTDIKNTIELETKIIKILISSLCCNLPVLGFLLATSWKNFSTFWTDNLINCKPILSSVSPLRREDLEVVLDVSEVYKSMIAMPRLQTRWLATDTKREDKAAKDVQWPGLPIHLSQKTPECSLVSIFQHQNSKTKVMTGLISDFHATGFSHSHFFTFAFQK